jgi:transporter family protein
MQTFVAKSALDSAPVFLESDLRISRELALMTGPLLALVAAVFFALHAVFVRRAVLGVQDSSIGILISVPLSLPILIPVTAVSGQLPDVLRFPWQSYLWLSAAGIFFFVVGRTLIYRCTQLLGANISSILIRTSVLISVIIGIVFLKEPLSWRIAAGVLLITTGIMMTGTSAQMFRGVDGGLSKIPASALMLGLGCGFSIGVSFVFVRLGLRESGAPMAGVLVAYIAATVVLGFSLLNRRKRRLLFQIPGRIAGLFFFAGIVSLAANIARFAALSITPASIVAPLVWTYPILLLFFSFLINRKIEIFNGVVVFGTITVVAGSLLLI